MTDHPRSRGVYGRHGRRRRETGGSSPLARGLHRRRGPGRRLHRIIPARAGFTTRRRRRGGPARDHPRSRGVYMHALPSSSRTPGSSPLARGLRILNLTGRPLRRIIPARAGFTPYASPPICAPQDHPRSRGVYAVRPALRRGLTSDHPRSRGVYSSAVITVRLMCGSSPLARGLRSAPRVRRCSPVDHPRSRGVYDSPHTKFP